MQSNFPHDAIDKRTNRPPPDELHYEVVAPFAPTPNLFSVTVEPTAPVVPGATRLVGPSWKKAPFRLTPPHYLSSYSGSSQPRHLRNPHRFPEIPPTLELFDSSSDSSPESNSGSQESSTGSPSLAVLLENERHVVNQVRTIRKTVWRCPSSAQASVTAPSELLEDLLREAQPAISPLASSKLPRRFGLPQKQLPAANPIAPVLTSDSRHVLVYPTDGTLASLSVTSLPPSQQHTSKSLPINVNTATPLLLNDGMVTHVRTADAFGGDPARVAAATSDTVAFGILDERDRVAMHSACSTPVLDLAISAYVDEISLLTPFSVRTSSSILSKYTDYDIQPLDSQYAFSSVSYSVHPRVLLLASQFSLATVDLRAPNASSVSPLFCVSDWCLPAYDSAVASFMSVPHAFQALVATQSVVVYFDIRVPMQPLLRLSYSCPTPVTRLTVLRSFYGDQVSRLSDIIAYAAPAHKVLDVAQAIDFSPDEPPLPLTAELPHPPFVWGGEPFHMGQAIPSLQSGDCPGLALLPDTSHARRINVVSWTASAGLTAVPLQLRPCSLFGDDNSMDSSDEEEEPYGAAPSTPLSNFASLDSSLSVSHDRQHLIASGVLKPSPADKRPVSACVGAILHSSTRKLPARLATRICTFICNDALDEFAGGVRIPHPSESSFGSRPDDEILNEYLSPDMGCLDLLAPFTNEELMTLVYDETGHKRNHHFVSRVVKALGNSRFVEEEAVTWHEECPDRNRHECFPACVSTVDDLPDWINRTVYYPAKTESIIAGMGGDAINRRNQEIEVVAPISSEYGQMMQRAWNLFFDDDKPPE